MNIVVAAFYHFFDFPHYAQMQQPLLEKLKGLGIRGSLLITSEGVNSTIAGSREAMDEFLAYLRTEVIKGDFSHKESFCEKMPFPRTKVRLKKETISLGETVSLNNIGTYVSPQEWNALMDDPDTIVLDTRNDYEVHLGTFEGAVDPNIHTFKQLPHYMREQMADAKQKKIATFCTGGIRCEKFTAWLKQEGYENVYHLEGGILKYLEEVPEAESKWQGECYVFDRRVAVGHGLVPSPTAGMCYACGHPLTQEDQASEHYIVSEQCPFCHDGAQHAAETALWQEKRAAHLSERRDS